MRFSSLHQLASLTTALALTASLAACTTTVVNGIGTGGTGGGGMTSSVSTGTMGNGGQAPSSDVIAIRYGDIPPVSGSGSGSGNGTTGTSGGIDPDSTEFDFSNDAISCGSGYWTFPCASWRVSFILAPAQLVVGTVDIATLNVVESEVGPADANGQCNSGGGGGGPQTGTLEIMAVDATSVTFRITGLDLSGFSGIDLNGDHTALRCPAK